jgi:hypothetical protein
MYPSPDGRYKGYRHTADEEEDQLEEPPDGEESGVEFTDEEDGGVAEELDGELMISDDQNDTEESEEADDIEDSGDDLMSNGNEVEGDGSEVEGEVGEDAEVGASGNFATWISQAPPELCRDILRTLGEMSDENKNLIMAIAKRK